MSSHHVANFGCSVPKATRRGGGSALPWKRRLFRDIVTSAVAAAGDLPVTIKMRIGIDDDHQTMLDAGRIAQDAGVAWVALHARTAAQRYSGTANRDAIATLKSTLDPGRGGCSHAPPRNTARRMVGPGSPKDILGQPRGRTGTPAKVILPQGWLADRDDDTIPEGTELDDSGG